jgi:hypothetical protein
MIPVPCYPRFLSMGYRPRDKHRLLWILHLKGRKVPGSSQVPFLRSPNRLCTQTRNHQILLYHHLHNSIPHRAPAFLPWAHVSLPPPNHHQCPRNQRLLIRRMSFPPLLLVKPSFTQPQTSFRAARCPSHIKTPKCTDQIWHPKILTISKHFHLSKCLHSLRGILVKSTQYRGIPQI